MEEGERQKTPLSIVDLAATSKLGCEKLNCVTAAKEYW